MAVLLGAPPVAAAQVTDWLTFFGADGYDYAIAEDVVIDRQDRATVVGWTKSTDFPTSATAYDRTDADNGDGFVTRLLKDGTGGAPSTYIGGAGWDPLYSVYSVAVRGSLGSLSASDALDLTVR